MSTISKIKAVIRAFKGIENKQAIFKTVLRTVRCGGIKELKKAAGRAANRGKRAEMQDLYELQQAEKFCYADTGIKVLFVVLAEQMDAHIMNTLESVALLKNIDKEVVLIAPKGYKSVTEIKMYAYENGWSGEVCLAVQENNADYVYFIRGGSYLAPNMAGEFFSDLSENNYPMIYSDECIQNEENKEYFLKSDFSRFDLLYNQNIGQSVAFPRKEIVKITLQEEQIERLSDMILYLALNISRDADYVKHVDQVLLVHKSSFKENVDWKRVKDINKQLAADKVAAKAILHNGEIRICSGSLKNSFSLVIPSDSYTDICNCVDSVLENTDYVSYEIIIVSSAEVCEKLKQRFGENNQFVYVVLECGSYAAACNLGANQSSGDILVFLQDDVKVIQKEWLYRMASLFAFSKVGGVSPKVIRNENTIRYAGIISGGFGFTPIPFNGEINERKENWNEPVFVTREVSVLSATCLAVRKDIFSEIHGFNESETPDKFSNAALSFELNRKGFHCIYCAETTVVAGQNEWYDSWYDKEEPRAYLFLLKEYGEELSQDSYFTEAMKQQYLRGVPKDFRIYKKKIAKSSKGSILMVSHDSLLGGATIALQYAARALKNDGYFVTFLVAEEGEILRELEKDGIAYIVDSSLYGNNEWMKYANNYDAIFLNTILMAGCVSKLQQYEKKIIWWVHEAEEYYKSVSSFDIKADKNLNVFCVGSYAQKVFGNYFPHIATKVLLYGMPDYRAKGEVVVSEERKVVFLSIGTIEKRKGQDILAEAIKTLSDEEREQCKFIFIGKPIHEEVFSKIQELYELYPNNIEVLRPVGREKVMELYDDTMCVICSSREDPMPVFMTECMMKSRVPICSENTGTAGVLQDGVDGLIYSGNSAEELAKKIRFVIVHREEVKKLAANARITYEKVFSMDNFTRNICGDVRKILEDV